ncbi:MAG TPA: tetratricopeptide repeat protein [Bryobacteraceae bacterium]|nr:tetratricopeptide repeat protein [Bryobacteraceae bacterium]
MHWWRTAWILALAGAPVFGDTAAVLPFWNSAPTPSQASLDWLGESTAETVADALGSRGILMLARPDIQDAFRRLGLRERAILSEASVMKIGEELDAEQIVYGTFEFTPAANAVGSGAKGSLKISGRILDLRRLRAGPAFVETGSIEDLATLQAHLAWRALELLAPALAPPESEFRSLRQPVRLDAEEIYVRGLLAANPEQREQFFLQAARLDPHFAHPCYQLGQIHYQRKEFRQAADWLNRVPPEDIHYREANFLLGLALFQSGDFAGAQKAFQMIVATVPLSEVYNNLGAAESRRNLPQAIDDLRKAIEGDPNDPLYQFNLGYALFKKGDFAAASQHFRIVLEHDPADEFAAALAARCEKKQGLKTGADARFGNLERLKTNYEERAYWQLKAMLEPKKP